MDEPVCPGCQDALKRIAELEARVAELIRKLEEAMRAGKRQAAPFRKGPPKPAPKTPGRKSGDAHGRHGYRPPPPGSVTECHQAPLPDACPHCHGPLVGTGTAEQLHTEIPRQPLVRKFVVHLGRCTGWGVPVSGRHPRSTSSAPHSAPGVIGSSKAPPCYQCDKQVRVNQRAKNSMKVSPILAIILALISLSLPACDMHKAEGQPHQEHHKIVVTSPKAKNIIITQQYVCQIHSKDHIELCARAFGVLEEIPVKEGQAVKKGDVMFKIAPQQYQAKYDAELGKFQVAQFEYENTKRLAETSADGKSPVVSQREVAIYKGKMAEAKGNLDKAETELNFATVRAPFDGIIDRQQKQQGSTVKEGEILTTLSNNSVMWVHFNVPEARYLEDMAAHGQNVKSDRKGSTEDLLAELNRTAKIELMLANGSKFPQAGKFASTGGKFNNETGNTTYRADFPNPDRLLRHGQTGNILINRPLKNAIVIPQRATFEILDKRYVYVVDKDDVVHQREIVVQHEMEDIFVIKKEEPKKEEPKKEEPKKEEPKKGLDVNDRIVLEGIRQVHEGEKVEYEFRDPEQVIANQKNTAE